MTYKQAIRLLHPDTTAEAIAEIECKYGFRGQKAAINKYGKACRLACKAMEKQIPKKPEGRKKFEGVWIGICPICGMGTNLEENFCFRCGQALDWRGEDDTKT